MEKVVAKQGIKELRKELKKDLKNGEYIIYIQPKIHLHKQKIGGAEALIRRNDNRLLSQMELIHFFEEEKIISYLDIYVFECVCKFLRDRIKLKKHIFPISLNFSRITLLRKTLIKDMERIIEKYNIDRSLIEIEITETLNYTDQILSGYAINCLFHMGYALVLDDFGSGYSNLQIIANVPFKAVKLDKSLIDNITMNEKNYFLVKGVIELCHQMGICVVAEGVEYEAQVNILKALDCDYVQGFYYEKPISIENFNSLY